MNSVMHEPRRCGVRFARALCGFAAVLGASATAFCAENPRFTLVYAANAVCPDEGALIDEIERRVPLAVRVGSAPQDVEAWIAIEREGARMLASVVVRRSEGTVRREVGGQDCDEVTRAAALILALAIDPDGASSAAPKAADPNSSPGPGLAVSVHPRPVRREVLPSKSWLGGGASVGLITGAGPHPVPSLGIFLEGGARSNALLAPRFRLTGLRAQSSVQTVAGTATLSLLALRAAACPLGFGAERTVELCVTFDWGRLRGRGVDTVDARQRDAAWYGPGVAVQAVVVVERWITFGAGMGALSPLARDRFYFRPDYTIHRIPPIAAYGALWLGLRT